MKKLEAAYEKANKDPERKKVLRELEAMDSIEDIDEMIQIDKALKIALALD